jgi:hypothetical protein
MGPLVDQGEKVSPHDTAGQRVLHFTRRASQAARARARWLQLLRRPTRAANEKGPTASGKPTMERDMEQGQQVMEQGRQIFLTSLSLEIPVAAELDDEREHNQRLVERARRLVILSSDAPEWAMAMERPALTRAIPICCG